MTSNYKETKIKEIELLRGFAILGVISVHVSAYFTEMHHVNFLVILSIIVDVFSHFAVPLFIFISGYILSFKYNGFFSEKLFYRKRAKSLLPQYFIFSILYLLLRIYLEKSLAFSLKNIVYKIITASSYYHLWYFGLIVQLYLLYPYINRALTRGNIKFFLILAFIVQEFWLISTDIFSNYCPSTFFLKFRSYFFISHIFYFFLGIYVCQNYSNVRYWIRNFKIKIIFIEFTLLTSLISYFWIKGTSEYGYCDIPPCYFLIPHLFDSTYYSLCIFIISMVSLYISNTKSWFSNIISSLGNYSFGIYLIHPMYIFLIYNLIFTKITLNPTNFLFYPLLYILTIVLSYISVYSISYLPKSEIIIGKSS